MSAVTYVKHYHAGFYGLSAAEQAFNEAHWLSRLYACDGFPKLFKCSLTSITMTYCGEHVDSATIPDDAEAQVERLAEDLAAANCFHRDIWHDNILVLDGRLYLIDFVWATWLSMPATPPDDAPHIGSLPDRQALADEVARWRAGLFGR